MKRLCFLWGTPGRRSDRLHWSLARQFAARGHLDAADDEFYLKGDELRSLIGQSAGERAGDTAGLARERRSLRDLQLRMNPPAAIPAQKQKGQFLTIVSNDSDAEVIHGFAVSPGIVTGVASFLRSTEEFDRTQPLSAL